MRALGDLIRPCGPVIDPAAAERARERLEANAGAPQIAAAWDALAPVFSASPYLAGLAARAPERLAGLLRHEPNASLARILEETSARATQPDPPDSARLEPSGGPGQATHKVSLRNAGEVDGEVVNLLHAAYEQNA